MAKTHSVKGCKTGRQFTKAVRSQGGWVEQGSTHVELHHPDGGKPVPMSRSTGDIGRSRFDMIARLIALGFAIFICVFPVMLLK